MAWVSMRLPTHSATRPAPPPLRAAAGRRAVVATRRVKRRLSIESASCAPLPCPAPSPSLSAPRVGVGRGPRLGALRDASRAPRCSWSRGGCGWDRSAPSHAPAANPLARRVYSATFGVSDAAVAPPRRGPSLSRRVGIAERGLPGRPTAAHSARGSAPPRRSSPPERRFLDTWVRLPFRGVSRRTELSRAPRSARASPRPLFPVSRLRPPPSAVRPTAHHSPVALSEPEKGSELRKRPEVAEEFCSPPPPSPLPRHLDAFGPETCVVVVPRTHQSSRSSGVS